VLNIDDIEAHGGGSVADRVYSVRFTSRELWGEAGADGEGMHVDLDLTTSPALDAAAPTARAPL
jgi:hypothetical protein